MITGKQLQDLCEASSFNVAIYQALLIELKIDEANNYFDRSVFYIDNIPFIRYSDLGLHVVVKQNLNAFNTIASTLNEFVLLYKLELLFKDDQ